MKNKNYVIDKDVIGNIVFITFLYLLVTFVLLDTSVPTQKSIGFWLFALLGFLYSVVYHSNNTHFIKQTDYELPFTYFCLLFSLWCGFTDLASNADNISKFNGIILLLSVGPAMMFIDYIANHRREKLYEENISIVFQIIKVFSAIGLFKFSLYFIVNGTWDWPIYGVIELLDILKEYMAEHHGRPTKMFL